MSPPPDRQGLQKSLSSQFRAEFSSKRLAAVRANDDWMNDFSNFDRIWQAVDALRKMHRTRYTARCRVVETGAKIRNKTYKRFSSP